MSRSSVNLFAMYNSSRCISELIPSLRSLRYGCLQTSFKKLILLVDMAFQKEKKKQQEKQQKTHTTLLFVVYYEKDFSQP